MNDHKSNTGCFLFCMLTLFFGGCLLFLIGFFPISHVAQTDANYSRPTMLDEFTLTPPKQLYAQTILMLVDALRHDFPSNTSMPFAYNATCGYIKLRVDIPTVTMPRLKSLTTGTLSNFIDIVLNLGHTEQLHDSLLHRLKQRGDSIVFAGDHTWANLFPNEFQRKAPNVDSFFVQDFNEGDKNVTKVLMRELHYSDWCLLILHYLGLDHIGHVEGSISAKIPNKLLEMDAVIRSIYNAEHFHKQFLLLTGDHGMRNGGGHGGSTPEELYVPLYYFTQNCTKKSTTSVEYNQIDLAPTLAILFAIDIPTPSIGCLIPELLQQLTLEEQLFAFYYNAQHLIEKATHAYGVTSVKEAAYFNWFNDAKMAHKQYLQQKRYKAVPSSFDYKQAKLNYMRVARVISDSMSKSLVNFDYALMTLGLALTTLTAIYTLLLVLFANANAQKAQAQNCRKQAAFCLSFAICINICAHYMHYITLSKRLYSLLLTVPIAVTLYIGGNVVQLLLRLLLPLRHNAHYKLVLTLPLPLLCCFIFHSISLASSSFIEEEHQTWYYLGATLLIALTVKYFYSRVRVKVKELQLITALQQEVWLLRGPLVMLSIIACIRKLNQTGDKWRHLQDFGDVLQQSIHKPWLSFYLALSLFLLLWSLQRLTTPAQMLCCALAALCIYCFRGVSGTVSFFQLQHFNFNIVLPIFWCCVVCMALLGYRALIWRKQYYGYEPRANLVALLQTNLCCSLLVAALLHKPHNVMLLPALLFTLQQVYKLCDSLQFKAHAATNTNAFIHKTLLTIIIAKMFYFYQGNSNSLATIDLNPGYVGQSSYQPLIVATFVTMNTYCAHINAFLYLVYHMFSTQQLSLPMRQEKEQITNVLLVQSTARDLQQTIALYTATTMLPVAVYLYLLVLFRYHLFVYTVFAPKAFYECFNVAVFYLNFTITNLYLNTFK